MTIRGLITECNYSYELINEHQPNIQHSLNIYYNSLNTQVLGIVQNVYEVVFSWYIIFVDIETCLQVILNNVNLKPAMTEVFHIADFTSFANTPLVKRV